MKAIKILVAVLFMGSAVFADHKDNPSPNHGDDDQDIVQVIEGPKGDPGEDGENGINGKDGVSPNIHHLQETQYILQGKLRLYDNKYWTFYAILQYDVRHTRGHQIGVGVTYKIGKSYEERQIERLERLVEELRKYAHYPLNSQILVVPDISDSAK